MDYIEQGSGRGSYEARERISPREGEMIKYRDTRTPLRFDLLSGDVVEGVVRWFDGMSVGVTAADRTEITHRSKFSQSYRCKTSREISANAKNFPACFLLEAPSGIEPLHKGFAGPSLTTWARRHER